MGKLNPRGLKALIERPGRYGDGQGLFFKTAGLGRAYWTYRYTLGGRDRETSIGPFPEMSLDEARVKHAALRAAVLAKTDPLAGRRGKAVSANAASGVPTFGQCADAYLKANAASWGNIKHSAQWAMTLTKYCAVIRSTPVDQVDTQAVLKVLTPIWNRAPATASRLRVRIEAVLASAQVDGWIREDRPNPARWKNWLERKLPKPKKNGSQKHHKAMPYADVPAFMARLAETPGAAAMALRFTILTAVRTGEALGMTWDEVSFDDAIWRVPASRMKMGRQHEVPLSDAALAILSAQHEARGKNPHVFAGRPQRPLSSMAMNMLLRRLGVAVTVHGFRSSARSWMADQGVPFELTEQCLAHVTGNAVVQAYQRSSMLERRRPIMSAWAAYVCGDADSNVVPFSAQSRRGAGQ